MVTEPLSGEIAPVRTLNKVVFPAPLAPIKPILSLSSTVKVRDEKSSFSTNVTPKSNADNTDTRLSSFSKTI